MATFSTSTIIVILITLQRVTYTVINVEKTVAQFLCSNYVCILELANTEYDSKMGNDFFVDLAMLWTCISEIILIKKNVF